MREMSVKGIVELVNSMPPAPVLVQKIIARIVKSAARYGIFPEKKEEKKRRKKNE